MGVTHASHYILYSADAQQTLLHKLKRTYRQLRQQRRALIAANNAATAAAFNQTTTQRKEVPVTTRRKLLPAMPRCSSLESLESGAAATAVKPSNCSAAEYCEWKRNFEAARPPISRTQRPRVLNITSALAGQMTPKGFPAYTQLLTPISRYGSRHSSNQSNNQSNHSSTASPHKTFQVRRRLSLRLPMLNSVARQPSGAPKEMNLYNNNTMRAGCSNQTRVVGGGTRVSSSNCGPISSTRISISNSPSTQTHTQSAAPLEPLTKPLPVAPSFLSKMCKEQANVIAKLYQEIKDMEEYYGTRKDYYYL